MVLHRPHLRTSADCNCCSVSVRFRHGPGKTSLDIRPEAPTASRNSVQSQTYKAATEVHLRAHSIQPGRLGPTQCLSRTDRPARGAFRTAGPPGRTMSRTRLLWEGNLGPVRGRTHRSGKLPGRLLSICASLGGIGIRGSGLVAGSGGRSTAIRVWTPGRCTLLLRPLAGEDEASSPGFSLFESTCARGVRTLAHAASSQIDLFCQQRCSSCLVFLTTPRINC